ncbi:NUDIX hydrolase [Amycolatopsis pithecellobii]|uniref:NUDIX domain-containing protein n=1 Tax=Amycolatopsis pithecellobii TaxID=664692 RepID=A0A6N7Z3K2_9PSEU|nr:NUDIX hydrolase [Amycolatopsis pithecellobii]MTD53526.1 NUDIX domain-containing protein [Amycolatopsis pithecellobii]
MDGDGFVECLGGHRHWGRFGAAGVLLADPDRGVLLQRRAWWTHHGSTWALPGGAIDSTESAWQAAAREAEEEAGIPRDAARPLSAWTVDHGGWTYTTVLAQAVRPVEARVMNAESDELRWVPPDNVGGYPLHQDFAAAWPMLRSELGRELLLVVDGANVVGSRPDGWWRDRLGAARRLRDQLALLAGRQFMLDGAGWSWWPKITLVVEGRARHTEPVDNVDVISATRDGDSTIVDTVRTLRAERPDDRVTVVTADRELRKRIEAEGAAHVGPKTLLTALKEERESPNSTTSTR